MKANYFIGKAFVKGSYPPSSRERDITKSRGQKSKKRAFGNDNAKITRAK